MNSEALERRLRSLVRDVPDYPKPGIMFKDVTPLLGDADAFAAATNAMAEPYSGAGVTHVVAIESRGFIFGGPVAQRLGAGSTPSSTAPILSRFTPTRSGRVGVS